MYPLQSIILEAFFVRKEKLFVSAVIRDNGDVIIGQKVMITTPNRKKRSRSEQARINQRAKESQTHLSGKPDL